MTAEIAEDAKLGEVVNFVGGFGVTMKTRAGAMLLAAKRRRMLPLGEHGTHGLLEKAWAATVAAAC